MNIFCFFCIKTKEKNLLINKKLVSSFSNEVGYLIKSQQPDGGIAFSDPSRSPTSINRIIGYNPKYLSNMYDIVSLLKTLYIY
jgi:hypothetical protein